MIATFNHKKKRGRGVGLRTMKEGHANSHDPSVKRILYSKVQLYNKEYKRRYNDPAEGPI